MKAYMSERAKRIFRPHLYRNNNTMFFPEISNFTIVVIIGFIILGIWKFIQVLCWLFTHVSITIN